MPPLNSNASPELRALLTRSLEAASPCLPMPAEAIRHFALGQVSTSTIGKTDHETLTATVAPDVIAGVLQRFRGAHSGTALLGLDPSDALLWLQMDGHDGEPLERFVELGGQMLGAIVAAFRGVDLAASDDLQFEPAALEERPLMAALLATHAPSDTVIVSFDAELAFDMDPSISTLRTPFTVQLMLEPKTLAPELQTGSN